MRYFLILLTFSCFSQNQDNQLLKIGDRTFVLFSEKSSKKQFSEFAHFKNKQFKTVDSIIAQRAVEELYIQSCNASKQFHTFTQESTFERLREEGNRKELRIYKKQVRRQNKYFLKYCPKWNKDLRKFDGQILAYINENTDLILWMQLFNFETDPHEIKRQYVNFWVTGFHGWFETNVQHFHFNANTNKISINEEL